MLNNIIPNKYKKWSTLIGGFLIQIPLGSVLSFGNMIPYITSYLREVSNIDIRYSQIIWILTSYSFSFSLSTLLCGLLTSKFKISNKTSILFGCFGLTLSIFLTFFTIKKSFVLVLLTYGVLFGVSSGFAYVGPLSIAMKWFPKNSGFSSSAILFGYGASSIVMNQIQTLYINPNNLSPDKPYSPNFPDEKYFSDKDLLNRVPRIFLILGTIYGILQLLGLSLITEKTETIPDEVINVSSEETQSLIEPSHELNSLGIRYERPNEGFTLNEAVRKSEFWILFVKILTQLVPSGVVVIYYKTFGQTFINDDKFLSQVGSIAALFNALSTFLWGFLVDHMSYKMCYLSMSTLLMVLTSTLYLIKFFGFKFLFAFYVGLMSMCQSGIYVIMPTIIVKTFGTQSFQAIYGALFLSTLLTSFITGELGSHSNQLGWFWMFITSALIAMIGWVLGFVFNVKKSNGEDI